MQSYADQSEQVAEDTQGTVNAVQEAKDFQATEGGVPVFRVQGGVLPNASQARFAVDEAGNLSIVGTTMLHINVNQSSHALEFLAKRGDTAEIVHFEVSPNFVDDLEAAAVPQHEAKSNPGLPQKDDWPKYPGLYGLPSSWFNKLLQYELRSRFKQISYESTHYRY